MARIQTPTNQKRLTNVNTVRYKRGGTRFELAVYPNTVEAYRAGHQEDLDEVLQNRVIFTNVSKGEVAKNNLWEKCFGTADEDEVIKIILKKGELQVGAKEREAALEKSLREIAAIVARKTVNPQSMLPYTITLVEKALKDVHYKPNPGKSSKKQAIEAVRLLARTIPIQRAKMRLRVTMPPTRALEDVAQLASKEETREEEGDSIALVLLIAPGKYRELDELVRGAKGSVTVLSLAVREELGEGELEDETQSGSQHEQSKGQSKQQKKKKRAQATAESSKRAQRKDNQLNDLLGAVDDDSDEEWKSNAKKGKGKKGKGRRKKK